jgi:hypothetical protein
MSAPLVFEYRWNNDRWKTSGEYPYFCDRNNPRSSGRPRLVQLIYIRQAERASASPDYRRE